MQDTLGELPIEFDMKYPYKLHILITFRQILTISTQQANHQPRTPLSLAMMAMAEMNRQMFRKRLLGIGLLGVPPRPTYSSLSLFFIASDTSPGLRSGALTGSGSSACEISMKVVGKFSVGGYGRIRRGKEVGIVSTRPPRALVPARLCPGSRRGWRRASSWCPSPRPPRGIARAWRDRARRCRERSSAARSRRARRERGGRLATRARTRAR